MAFTRRCLARLGWVGALGAVGLALAVSTGPLLHAVRAAGSGPDDAVAAAAALAAWVALGWLSLGLALTLLETSAAAVGAGEGVLPRLAAAVTPAALRTAVHASLRVGLIAGTVGAAVAAPTLAWAAPPPAVAVLLAEDVVEPARWPVLDRPASAVDAQVTPRASSQPTLDRPAARTERTERTERPYRVRAGDTLWSIAKRHLPIGATDAEIARSWPRWWQANRAVVGPDPSLIRPGQVLRAPGTAS